MNCNNSSTEPTPSSTRCPLELQADVQAKGDNAVDMNVSMDNAALRTDTSDSSCFSSEDTSNNQIPPERLEDRIGTMADCIFCKHLPICPYYQCAQGHLLCASCYAIILSNDVGVFPRGKCPRCSELLIDSVYNPVAEILSKEMYKQCYYCGGHFLGHKMKKHHQKCLKRLSKCPYSVIGCTWEGYRDELDNHKNQCEIQNLTGNEALEFVTSPKDQQQLKNKQDVENFLNEMPLLNSKMLYKPPLGTNLLSDLYFFAGTFKCKGYKWLMDLVWRPKDEAFNGKSTISYRLKIFPPIRKVEGVKLRYFVVKGAYREEDFNTQVNNVTFTSERCLSPESVFIVDTAEYCERLLINDGIYIRICYA